MGEDSIVQTTLKGHQPKFADRHKQALLRAADWYWQTSRQVRGGGMAAAQFCLGEGAHAHTYVDAIRHEDSEWSVTYRAIDRAYHALEAGEKLKSKPPLQDHDGHYVLKVIHGPGLDGKYCRLGQPFSSLEEAEMARARMVKYGKQLENSWAFTGSLLASAIVRGKEGYDILSLNVRSIPSGFWIHQGEDDPIHIFLRVGLILNTLEFVHAVALGRRQPALSRIGMHAWIGNFDDKGALLDLYPGYCEGYLDGVDPSNVFEYYMIGRRRFYDFQGQVRTLMTDAIVTWPRYACELSDYFLDRYSGVSEMEGMAAYLRNGLATRFQRASRGQRLKIIEGEFGSKFADDPDECRLIATILWAERICQDPTFDSGFLSRVARVTSFHERILPQERAEQLRQLCLLAMEEK